MLDNMMEYYNFVSNNNINTIYSGPIWSDGVEGIGNALRKKLEFDEMPLSVSQAVFSVFVEQMNNMLHYSKEKDDAEPSNLNQSVNTGNGIIILGSENKRYFLQTGNVMKTTQKNVI